MGDFQGKTRTHSGLRVSGAWARGVVNAFEAVGLDPEALCEQIGADLEIFTDTSGRPPRDALGRFWRAALSVSSDRHLGLSAAECWTPRADHLVILLLTSAETLGEGLEAGVRFQKLMSHGRVVTLGQQAGHHSIELNKVEHELPVTAHQIEFLSVILLKLMRFATGGRFNAHEVQFDHPYRGNIQKYTRAFNCSVVFGEPRTVILADDANWNLPLVHGNQALHGQLRSVASGLHSALESHDFIDTVRDRMKLLLPRGQTSIEAVANALHMTPRTLQRRLQEDGSNFRALMDATRRSILVACVERKETPDEIMRHAGYTNVRSFQRAMKRWKLTDIR